MKSKLLYVILGTLVFSACEQRHSVIKNELKIIEQTEKDTTQPDYIRESAATFGEILIAENNVSKNDWIVANGDMMELKNETTISTFVAFLKALEKKLPEDLPSVEQYNLLKDRTSKAKFIEPNVARTVLMMGESMKEISLYGDATADAEVEGILKRFTEKHGNSDTGKTILEFFNMVHDQGLKDQAKGIKPWESPRRAGAGGSDETVD